MNINTIIQSLENFQGIAILLVAVWLAWKVASWKATVDGRLTGVEKAIDRIEKAVETLTQRMDALTQRMDALTQRMDTLTHKVDDIYRWIMNDSFRSIEKVDSPIALSEYGKELFYLIDAEKIVNQYAEKMYNETQEMNAYKVQEYCFTYCKEKLMDELEENDKEQSEKMALVAFDQGIDMERITRIVGIALRDRVLQKGEKMYAEVGDRG